MREILKKQMIAALSMLNQAIENCPEAEWQQSHNDAPFSQAAFHALFFLDYYLSHDDAEFKAQGFHTGHPEIFQDYEELEDRLPEHTYTREQIRQYLRFCRQKTERVFEEMGEGGLMNAAIRDPLTVAELAVDNIRHVQHHAAQLGLRVQQITGKTLNWATTGWRD
jgi:hypothetical protein